MLKILGVIMMTGCLAMGLKAAAGSLFRSEEVRTHRMLNECVIDKIVTFLTDYYKREGEYPDETEWARVIHKEYLTGERDDCSKVIQYEDDSLKDYFGDNVRYVFENKNHIMVYSKNAKYLSSDKGNALMSFVLKGGEVVFYELFETEDGYKLVRPD